MEYGAEENEPQKRREKKIRTNCLCKRRTQNGVLAINVVVVVFIGWRFIAKITNAKEWRLAAFSWSFSSKVHTVWSEKDFIIG